MYIHVYTCVYVYIHINMYKPCLNVFRPYIYMAVSRLFRYWEINRGRPSTQIYIYIYINTYIYIYIYIYTCVYRCIYIYIYTHICIHIHIHTKHVCYIYMYRITDFYLEISVIYIYIYICI